MCAELADALVFHNENQSHGRLPRLEQCTLADGDLLLKSLSGSPHDSSLLCSDTVLFCFVSVIKPGYPAVTRSMTLCDVSSDNTNVFS